MNALHLAVDELEGALCAQVDAELFFPDQGGNPRAAKDICRQCPVRLPCLQVALDSDWPVYGIWGGTSEKDRRELRRAAA